LEACLSIEAKLFGLDESEVIFKGPQSIAYDIAQGSTLGYPVGDVVLVIIGHASGNSHHEHFEAD
jgi:hypothetical protein